MPGRPGPGRHGDGLAWPEHAGLTVEDEVCLARCDVEALLLEGVDVLGDLAARLAAPTEAHDVLILTRGLSDELDRLAGGGVDEGAVCLGGAHAPAGAGTGSDGGSGTPRSGGAGIGVWVPSMLI